MSTSFSEQASEYYYHLCYFTGKYCKFIKNGIFSDKEQHCDKTGWRRNDIVRELDAYNRTVPSNYECKFYREQTFEDLR